MIGFGLILVGWMNRCSTDRSRLPVRITKPLPEILELIGGAGFDRVIVETVGAGQNETKIRECVDRTAVVVVPGMGDSIQMDKAGILEIADCFVVNKSDYEGLERLRRELKDACGGRPIVETVATEGRGTETLLETLFG